MFNVRRSMFDVHFFNLMLDVHLLRKLSAYGTKLLKKDATMSQQLTEEELKLTISNLRKELLALKQSENASKIELSELNQIFQTVADGVVVIDKDFNVIRVRDLTNGNASAENVMTSFPGPCATPRDARWFEFHAVQNVLSMK